MVVTRGLALVALAVIPSLLPGAAQTSAAIATHDNLKSAGRVQDGELRLALWAGTGRWYPEGDKKPARNVEAFGEEGAALSIPAPLIRVTSGTAVRATVRNTLPSPLRITGLCDRPGSCDPVTIPAGESREIRFTLTSPGTFHYFGLTTVSSLLDRDGVDSQLGGAIVVDPPGAVPPDRIFVMGLLVEDPATPGIEVTTMNGRSWPLTERLNYTTGDSVRWRVVNLTNSPHAMHLHGFYFRVDSFGDGVRDTASPASAGRMAVTEQMAPGRVMAMTWVPERSGNWLFHCHMLTHMMPPDEHHGGAAGSHPEDASAAGMAGLVLGVRVTGADRVVPESSATRRHLRLTIDPDKRHASTPSYRVSIAEGARPAVRLNDAGVPGPVMVLTRGEPVAVEVVNHLQEPTAIHWHGIELDSYSDGVPGFGGIAGSVTPPVAPGGTFTARFTPPRAGTFIYHTHWHNAAQLAGGIYGPLIVLEPGQTYDPSIDHIVVIGLDGANLPLPNEPVVVNGESRPRPLMLKAGVPNLVRFINITPSNVAFTVQLLARFDPMQWTLVGKDGMATPVAARKPQLARQLVTVGETYDFELTPATTTDPPMWMELRRGSGELMKQWAVRVR
jgi:FtsP/CotA-like multicopper oxidase with cupredoxin domain